MTQAANTPWRMSLIRGDLLFRLQRKIGLIPASRPQGVHVTDPPDVG